MACAYPDSESPSLLLRNRKKKTKPIGFSTSNSITTRKAKKTSEVVNEEKNKNENEKYEIVKYDHVFEHEFCTENESDDNEAELIEVEETELVEVDETDLSEDGDLIEQMNKVSLEVNPKTVT
jgi:hypothetical protein